MEGKAFNQSPRYVGMRICVVLKMRICPFNSRLTQHMWLLQVEEAKKEFDTGANRSGEMEGEVGSGAQIAWNTGIAEIALPIEFKIQ